MSSNTTADAREKHTALLAVLRQCVQGLRGVIGTEVIETARLIASNTLAAAQPWLESKEEEK